MAHEITQNAITGAFEFAYRADHGHPWHVKETGAGRAVDPAKVDDTEEWKQHANMNWRALRSVVRYATERGENPALALMPEQHVIFRSDTREPLSVVSKAYKTVHPGEILDLFQGLLGAGGYQMSACGTLFGGREFWATARLGADAQLSTFDPVTPFALVHTSLDGSHATTVQFVTERGICKNTIRMAFAERRHALKINHRTEFSPTVVRDFLGQSPILWAKTRASMLRLANTAVTPAEAENTLERLFASAAHAETLTLPGDVLDKVRESAGFMKTLALFNGAGMGSRLDTAAGTAWGLLNAVTEYADHHARARSDANRWVSAQFGTGDALKSRIAALLTA